jgi:hypothetical protein
VYRYAFKVRSDRVELCELRARYREVKPLKAENKLMDYVVNERGHRFAGVDPRTVVHARLYTTPPREGSRFSFEGSSLGREAFLFDYSLVTVIALSYRCHVQGAIWVPELLIFQLYPYKTST